MPRNKASATATAVQPLTTALILTLSLRMGTRRLDLGDLGSGQQYFIHDLMLAQ
jgi:hypothetical protein